MKALFEKLVSFGKWLVRASLPVKAVAVIALIGLGWFGYTRIKAQAAKQPTYQTAMVEKGTLIVSVSVSGQVSSANSAEVTTQASGVVKTVYVKDGDTVQAGDKIAELELDLVGKQRQQSAYASYQSSQNTLETAKANLYTNQSTMLTEWKTYLDLAQNSTYENADDTPNVANRQLVEFVTNQDDWLAAEAKYKVQEKAITQAQTSLNSSWYSYQQTSPTIVAPIAGIVTGLSLQPGTVITAQTNSSGGSSSQRIASVKTAAAPTVSLNITQIDAPKVKAGDKATLTFDAFADKTFTGEVVSIDTIGSESSGVVTYPAIIKLDAVVEGLLPNMSATANIITATKADVLLVPSTAVQTQNGTSYLQVMKNGQMNQVEVEIGLSSDSQTEIISGVVEGDTVVTSVTNGTTSGASSGQSTSPFSPFGRTGSSGQLRMITR